MQPGDQQVPGASHSVHMEGSTLAWASSDAYSAGEMALTLYLSDTAPKVSFIILSTASVSIWNVGRSRIILSSSQVSAEYDTLNTFMVRPGTSGVVLLSSCRQDDTHRRASHPATCSASTKLSEVHALSTMCMCASLQDDCEAACKCRLHR